jgi:phospholipid/cholesterol/gamma-HCH transport system substrate-binding protein
LESRAHALAAGVFIVVMSLCVGAAVWYLSGSSERGRDFVLATNSAVSGLNPQAQVRYRGIRVGKVQDISINPSNPREILVRVNIPERYPVTMATRARLSFLGVTGLALIDIEDDGSDATPLRPGADGTAARIPLRGSQFDALGTQAADTMQVLREVLLRLNALLDERNVERISATLANLQSATSHLDATLAGAPAVVRQAQDVFERSRELLSQQNTDRISRILAHAEAASSQSAPLAQDLRALLASMKQLSDRLDALALAAGPQVTEDTLPRLQSLIDEAQRNSRQLGRVLGELESSPQMLLLGRENYRPGPGEAGFGVKSEGVGR